MGAGPGRGTMGGQQPYYGNQGYQQPFAAGPYQNQGAMAGRTTGTGLGQSMGEQQFTQPSMKQFGFGMQPGAMGQPGHMGNQWRGNLTGDPMRTGGAEPPIGAGSAMEQPGRMYAGGSPNQGLAGQENMGNNRPYQWAPIQQNPNPPWYGSDTAPPAQGQMPPQNSLANFRSLLQQDPHAASEALNFNPAFMMQNMGALSGMVPGGDFGQWRNQYGASTSNAGPITDAQRALIRQRMGW